MGFPYPLFLFKEVVNKVTCYPLISFILGARLLILLIYNDDSICGINTVGKKYKMTQYADDTNFFIHANIKSIAIHQVNLFFQDLDWFLITVITTLTGFFERTLQF